ncbi:MAG: GNAT family N-acetyltransferase [Promethearchaeota archaeon]
MIIENVTKDDLYDIYEIEKELFGEDAFEIFLLHQYLKDNYLFIKAIDDANQIIGFSIIVTERLVDLMYETSIRKKIIDFIYQNYYIDGASISYNEGEVAEGTDHLKDPNKDPHEDPKKVFTVEKDKNILKINNKSPDFIYRFSEIVGILGHVVNIAVHRDHIGKGIGRSLMNFTIDQLRNDNIRFLLLEVNTLNFNAIKFYKSLGFIKVLEIKNYYSSGNDAYVMVNEIL